MQVWATVFRWTKLWKGDSDVCAEHSPEQPTPSRWQCQSTTNTGDRNSPTPRVDAERCREGLTRPLSTISFCRLVDVSTRSLIAWNEGKQVLVFGGDFMEQNQSCQWQELQFYTIFDAPDGFLQY